MSHDLHEPPRVHVDRDDHSAKFWLAPVAVARTSDLPSATPAQRENWRLAGGGLGIHWPDVDEDLSTEGLLRGAPAPRQAR